MHLRPSWPSCCLTQVFGKQVATQVFGKQIQVFGKQVRCLVNKSRCLVNKSSLLRDRELKSFFYLKLNRRRLHSVDSL